MESPRRAARSTEVTESTIDGSMGGSLTYSNGIAAARTLLALEANAIALQRRLPSGWELSPYAGDDLRGKAFRGANLLLPFHEVFATRSRAAPTTGLPQLSYLAFVSHARNRASGNLAHFHWLVYTEDPAGVPGKYRDAKLARITRSQTFTKGARGETRVREEFSAVSDTGRIHLSLAYRQGGMVMWVTAEKPNLPMYAAQDPAIVRWYQEDQVLDIVRSDPMKINGVTEI